MSPRVEQVGCRALVMSSRFKSSDYDEMIQGLIPNLANCKARGLLAVRLTFLCIRSPSPVMRGHVAPCPKHCTVTCVCRCD